MVESNVITGCSCFEDLVTLVLTSLGTVGKGFRRGVMRPDTLLVGSSTSHTFSASKCTDRSTVLFLTTDIGPDMRVTTQLRTGCVE